MVESGDVGSVDVSVLMHRAGINLRFIGLLIGSLQSYWDLEKPGLIFLCVLLIIGV